MRRPDERISKSTDSHVFFYGYNADLGSPSILNLQKMKEKKKDEELQSRRDFFRNAAKAALPIIGAVVLSHIPIVAKNTSEPTGCNYGCAGTCYGSCSGTCSGTCNALCYERCVTSCQGSCKGGCTGTCAGSCVNNGCAGSCHYSCTGLSY